MLGINDCLLKKPKPNSGKKLTQLLIVVVATGFPHIAYHHRKLHTCLLVPSLRTCCLPRKLPGGLPFSLVDDVVERYY